MATFFQVSNARIARMLVQKSMSKSVIVLIIVLQLNLITKKIY